MGSASEHIRVSDAVKRALDSRRRAGESYNDVLERLLVDRERDLMAGFGRWDAEDAVAVRAARERGEEKAAARRRDPGER